MSTALAAGPSGSASAASAWKGNTLIAEGGGERGPWRQNDSRYDYVDDPTVAIGNNGGIVTAWVEQARKDVFLQAFSAAGEKRFAQPVNVSRSPATFSWLPRIALAPNDPDRIFMLWQEIIFSGGSHGGDILFSRSSDGGVSFSPPMNLSNSIGGDGKGRISKDVWHNGSLDLAVASDGALYAAWTEYDGQLWFARSTDGGNSFTQPQRLAGSSARPARAPSLALGPGRTVYLAWTTGEDAGADIHLIQSADGGRTFGEAKTVAPSATYSDAPKLAVDGEGVLHLVYAESAGGPFDSYRVRYARSMDGGRSFDAAHNLSAETTNAAFPSLAIDARNRLVVIWENAPDRQQHPRGLVMTFSADGGRSFSAPIAVPGSSDPAGGTNGSHQGLLMKKLAVNDAGAVAIVNSSLKPNDKSRVWLMRAQLPP